MSVAFTKEQDGESAAADLPDRPISPHPNLVTASGLALLEAGLAQARAAYSTAQAQGDVQADRMAMARATRDLRYYSARRASAQLMETAPEKTGIQFGDRVTFVRDDGRRQTFRIVGEDEADPAAGSVSYLSPLARVLLGAEIGDRVSTPAGDVEIASIAPETVDPSPSPSAEPAP